MAVLPQASLGSIVGRIGRNRLFVEHGVDLKFAGDLISTLQGTRELGQPISPAGFPPFPPVSTIDRFDFPTIPAPTTTAFDPFPTTAGAGTGGSLGEAACNLLRGTARDFCLASLRLIPTGNGTDRGIVADPSCPPGMVRIKKICVDLTALPPGGDPAFIPAGGGRATVGAFGLPALSPQGITRVVRKCGRGMVLGIDNLCYPKAVLTGRSKFRKWRRPVRPPISRRDVVAIKRAAGARDRVKELAKDVGLKVGGGKKRAPKRHSEKHK